MKTTAKILSIVGFCLMPNTLAWAGNIELQVLQGDVLIDQGKGLVAVQGTTNIFPGGKLVLRENSAALLNYVDEQCFIRLAPASVTRIAEVAPCDPGSFAAVSKTSVIEPVNGVYEVIPPPPPSAGITPLIAAGSFVAASVATSVWAVTKEETTPPVSSY